MDDYIIRQAAIAALEKEREYLIKNKMLGAEHILVHHALCVVDEIPSADVRPVVRSEWVFNDNRTWHCKRCKSWIPDEQRYYANWCLFCGADMREELNGNDDHDPG